jgi:ribonuclease BN (tRNA processing enzyme)
VKVTLIPSATSERLRRRQFTTSYLFNGTVAVDAGSLGFYLTPRAQARVKHLFLTHTHLDHLASLPMFLDQAHTDDGECVTIHAAAPVLDCLRRDVFNDRLWPNLIRIGNSTRPYLKMQEIKPGRAYTVAGMTFTPVAVDHIVPTIGYVIDDGKASVVIATDTGPTEEIWRYARERQNLKAVFLEATFPEAKAWLADIAKHMTPRLFAAEAAKLPAGVRLFAVHIHPRDYHDVTRELKALGLKNLRIARFGEPYRF